jgi:hypothetical protein
MLYLCQNRPLGKNRVRNPPRQTPSKFFTNAPSNRTEYIKVIYQLFWPLKPPLLHSFITAETEP